MSAMWEALSVLMFGSPWQVALWLLPLVAGMYMCMRPQR